MFYLLKRVDEKQCIVSERVMVLADFNGIEAGQKGIICEIYNEGVMVAWVDDEFTESRILRAMELGRCNPANGFGTDGFSRDELEYLAFATAKHPTKA